jgi:hypothetical protein
MNDLERENYMYLGDGVYVYFNGMGLWLRTGHHEESKCDDKIYLEGKSFKSLCDFVENLKIKGKF